MGVLAGAIHALATVVFGVDHIVSGVAINLLGAGAGSFLAVRTFTGLQGGGPTVAAAAAAAVPLHPGHRRAAARGLRSPTCGCWDLVGILRAVTTNVNALTIPAVGLLVGSWWVLGAPPSGCAPRWPA